MWGGGREKVSYLASFGLSAKNDQPSPPLKTIESPACNKKIGYQNISTFSSTISLNTGLGCVAFVFAGSA
jgi:hypothetical protein